MLGVCTLKMDIYLEITTWQQWNTHTAPSWTHKYLSWASLLTWVIMVNPLNQFAYDSTLSYHSVVSLDLRWPKFSHESNLTENVDHLVNTKFLHCLLNLRDDVLVDLYDFETFIMKIVDAHLNKFITIHQSGLDKAVTMDIMGIEISHCK